MSYEIVDLNSWARADQFRFFKDYDRPHYAITSRIDITRLLTSGKAKGISPYRACLFAIGAGVHAVPELLMRFRGDTAVRHACVEMSMTVPTQAGNFNYAYVPFEPDFSRFDATSKSLIEAAGDQDGLNANAGERDDLVYLSCLPWLDYSSLNNAMPGADDCIPRISWGKFVEAPDGNWSMAMTLEVHHALVDGAQVGAYFEAVQLAVARF